nr:MAG TPA: hypothetical protein [Caudoviricetes sp.]
MICWRFLFQAELFLNLTASSIFFFLIGFFLQMHPSP